jgi:hypothetical protein
MHVCRAQPCWFDDLFETNESWQRAYLTVDGLAARNVIITAPLNVFAPGADSEVRDGHISGDLSTAAVGITWYDVQNESGGVHGVCMRTSLTRPGPSSVRSRPG